MSYIALAFGVGVAAGLRSLSPPAVVAWAAHLGWLNLNNSPLAFMGSIITVVIFSLLAVFELIADLLPQTGKRTAPVSLAARVLMGGLCGKQSTVSHRRDSGRGRRSDRRIRRLRNPAPFGRRVACQRHFRRFARRLGRDRTRLFLRYTLTPGASRADELQDSLA